MANKRSDRSVKDVVITPYISFRWFLINLFIMFFGPLFLIYLVLRCDKNQCLLLQMPLVIPWLPRVYFSMFSIYSVLGYIIIVLLLAITHVPALARTENQGIFGIIVYISSSQQKENFAEDNLKYKNLRSVAAYGGKRFLISGYWGMVQKPDYIGYMIIWFSWTVACGFSYLSLIVLTIIYGSVFSWTQQATRLKQHTLGNSSWVKYEQAVPNKLIPYLY
ncbi:hypothetical protein Btru_024221 [Bulinus truncatus]|nr:hypothetical protein Btru_024221 [Bulinus truncatus]